MKTNAYVIGLITCIIGSSVIIYHLDRVDASELKLNKTPTVNDPDLKVEIVSQMDFKFDRNSLSPVTSMAFLGSNDILLLEKNKGIVHRITNGSLLGQPLLDVNVANERERGLLGIAVATNASTMPKYVYLYFTESSLEDGEDNCPKPLFACRVGTDPLGNRLYRYELVNNRLVNAKLLLDLPAIQGPVHNGGVIKIGPDNNIYIVTGDLVSIETNSSWNKAQNNENGKAFDGKSGILRITQQGKSVGIHGILGDSMPLRLYFAYGIRNSFGLDFDPITGNLWDTENGGDYRGDEINLVKPGFNSGWIKVEGLWEPEIPQAVSVPTPFKTVDFNGKGKYSLPELSLNFTVGPTALVFLNSDKLGREYSNDLFVGSVHYGSIFHFNLNNNRSSLELHGDLSDKIANSPKELQDVTFATGFGAITDLDVGPDGYLYILSFKGTSATISKIVPKYT
jgi:glucose/arabinose dehydrogenase